MNAEKPSLAIALKTLWGAAEMPFGDACAEPFRHPNFEELTRRLQQLCEIGASGLLHGPNGIGKSYWSFHNLGDVTALKKGPNQGRAFRHSL